MNALAAVAAARALGASQEVVVERLGAFDPPVHNPGRGTLLRLGDVSLFVDYAHNPAALAAVLRTLHRLWGPDRCLAAVTLPGDRRDDLLAASAQVLADGVSRAVLYDDEDPCAYAARPCDRSAWSATASRSRRRWAWPPRATWSWSCTRRSPRCSPCSTNWARSVPRRSRSVSPPAR
jgi:cyanophycin synthetase